MVCGTLVAAASRTNIHAMREREPDNPALERYARVAEILLQQRFSARDEALERLIQLLRQWTEELQLEGLARYGVNESGLDRVVAQSHGSSMKTNPIVLTDQEIRSILLERM